MRKSIKSPLYHLAHFVTEAMLASVHNPHVGHTWLGQWGDTEFYLQDVNPLISLANYSIIYIFVSRSTIFAHITNDFFAIIQFAHNHGRQRETLWYLTSGTHCCSYYPHFWPLIRSTTIDRSQLLRILDSILRLETLVVACMWNSVLSVTMESEENVSLQ